MAANLSMRGGFRTSTLRTVKDAALDANTHKTNNLEARVGFEPTNGSFADSPWKRILLVRLAFTPALIPDFRPYSAAIVPKLFLAFGSLGKCRQVNVSRRFTFEVSSCVYSSSTRRGYILQSETRADSGRVFHVQVYRAPDVKNGNRRVHAMRSRRFHVLVALILLVCLVSPYVEADLDWNESIFTTGFDTESIVAVIALLLILSLTLANLMAVFLPAGTGNEQIVTAQPRRKREYGFVLGILEVSPPLPLRI
jgi:hypothetical protein